MIIRVIDKRHMTWKLPIEGKYDQGVFKYKVGGLPIFGWGSVEKTIKIDGTKAIRNKKGVEEALVFWDGKEYEQLDMGVEHAKDQTSYSDLLRDVKIANYVKKAMISQPQSNLQTIFNIVLAILIIAAATSAWYDSQSLKNTQAPLIANMKNITALNTATIKVLVNQSQLNNALLKKLSGASYPSSNSSLGSLPSAP